MPTPIKILFIAAEAEPIIKIGGLADVAGTLPLVLRKLTQETAQDRKLDVRLALPFHRSSRADPTIMLPTTEVMVYRQGGNLKAKVFEFSLKGMPVYFIDGEPIHTAESVYSTDPALDREKYTFFSLAVLEMLRHIDWQPDILHANDWHTAPAIYALKTRYKNDGFFSD